MNKQSQWLFETPPALKENCSCKRRFPRSSYANFEREADWEAPTVVLQSPQFRNDSRLQAAANNRPAMRQNERGPAVQKLQQALIELGFPMPVSTQKSGRPDGIYGAETVATVRKFQQRFGLKVDGVAGRETLSKLDQLLSPSGTGSCESDCERQFQDCVPSLGQTECRRRFRRCLRDCRGIPV